MWGNLAGCVCRARTFAGPEGPRFLCAAVLTNTLGEGKCSSDRQDVLLNCPRGSGGLSDKRLVCSGSGPIDRCSLTGDTDAVWCRATAFCRLFYCCLDSPSVLILGHAECIAPEPGTYAVVAQRKSCAHGGTKACHYLSRPQRVMACKTCPRSACSLRLYSPID